MFAKPHQEHGAANQRNHSRNAEKPTRIDHNRRCTGAELKLAGIWDAPRQQSIGEAFERTGVPYAGDVWRALQSSLDGYAQAWAQQHTSACEATWFKGEQSDAVLSLRMHCLNDRLDELRSLTEVLLRADVDAVDAAPKAAGSLTDLARCADVTALERRTPLPKNAADQRKAEALQHEMAEVSSLVTVGRYQEALSKIEQVVNEARALGYAPIEAEATLWLLRINGRLGRFSAVAELAFETIRLAEVAGDDGLRFDGIVSLARLGQESGGESLEQLLIFCELAKHALSRIKSPEKHLTRLQVILGNIHLTRDDPKLALEAYERGLAIAVNTPGDTEVLLDLTDNIALAHHLLHRDYEALAEYQGSLARLIKRVGPNHPDVAYLNLDIAEVYIALNQPTLALPYIELAFAVRQRVLGAMSMLGAESQMRKAEALGMLGRFDEAEAEMITAQRILEQTAPEGPTSLQTLIRHGELQLANHQPSRALALFDQAAALAAKLGATQPTLGQGLALLELKRFTEAEARLKKAVPELMRAENNAELFRAHLALAQVLWQRGDKRAARELGEQALSDLAPVEGDTAERQETIRRWLREHPAPSP